MTTPMIDRILANPNTAWGLGGDETRALATELRALKANAAHMEALATAAGETLQKEKENAALERENLSKACAELERMKYTHEGDQAIIAALSAELAALNPPAPTPTRRLREYKGVEYNPTFEHWVDVPRAGDVGIRNVYHCASEVIERNLETFRKFTDADHAALLDLKAHPDEPAPVETLEAVVDEWYMSGALYRHNGVTPEEDLADLCTRLRAHLAPQPVTLSAERYQVLDGWWNVYRNDAVRHTSKERAESKVGHEPVHTAVRLAVILPTPERAE